MNLYAVRAIYYFEMARTGRTLLQDLSAAGIRFKDIQTNQSSLEEIFVSLVRERP